MRLISTLLVGLVLITHYGRFISCNDSSEEVDRYKNFKKCPGGYCVSPHLCRNGSINVDGDDIIEMRFGEDPIDIDLHDQSDPCEQFLQRCCAVNEDAPSQPLKSTEPNPQPDNNDSDDGLELPAPTCGINHPNGFIYRVNEGGTGQFGEFPWMAALLQSETPQDKETLKYFCGGSLIHQQVILTAAHCVKSFTSALDTLVVRLGEWDTVTENEPLKHENLAIRKIILHESYVDRIFHNDLALLILERPASLNKHIRPICLPTNADDNFDGERCMVSGWGKENFSPEGKYSEVLKKIEVPVIPRKQCKQMFRATSLGPFFQLHKSFMCAGGEAGVDTCKGDGGSPLACQRDDGAFVQAGIVAWGIGCGGEGIPGAYVKVSNFVEWIAEKMQGEGV